MNTLNIFKNQIQKNREICNGCYRRIRCVIPPPTEEQLIWRKTSDGWRYRRSAKTLIEIVTETSTEAGEGEFMWVPGKRGPYGEFISASHPQIVCGVCGTIDSTDETKSTGELIKDGRIILERLEEDGFELDWDDFFDSIRELKSDPELCGKDYKVLSISISESVISTPESTEP